MRRRSAKLGLGLFILYLLASFLCGAFLAEFTVHLPRRPLRHQARAAAIIKEQYHTVLQDVEVTAVDGVVLRAWYVAPHNWNGETVTLLHGITDNREGVAGFAPMFLDTGYAVLIPDSRAHGESGGTLATYGVKERYDIEKWNEWLQQRSTGCTYIFGESMGAAIGLQATEVVPILCAVAVESPFSTFREIAYDRMAGHTPFGTWFWRTGGRPLIEFALAYARLRYQVDLTAADPEAALKHSRVPALLIAGTADHNIPMRHSAELQRTSASHVQMWVVEGADHGGAVSVSHDEFRQRILNWFREHQRPN